MRVVASTTRLLVVSAATLAILSLQVGSTGCWLAPVEDCYQGMEIGETVEVELVEVYRRDGPYTFWDMSLPDTTPSCEGVDGLTAGMRLQFQIVSRGTASDDCYTHQAQPVTLPIGVTLLPQSRAGPGVLLGDRSATPG